MIPYFEEEIKWDPPQQYVGEVFYHSKESEHYPVRQPESVITFVFTLYCLTAVNTHQLVAKSRDILTIYRLGRQILPGWRAKPHHIRTKGTKQ